MYTAVGNTEPPQNDGLQSVIGSWLIMCNIVEVPIGFSDLLPKDLSPLASPQATPVTVHPRRRGSIACFFLLGIF